MENLMQKLEEIKQYIKTALDYMVSEAKDQGKAITVQDFGCESWPDENFAMFDLRIKECPGFLFGVWYSDEYLKFFAQYEKDINKFKPSHSFLKVESRRFTSIPDELFLSSVGYDWARLVAFIQKYPALAWFKDFYYCGEFEYCSLAKAKRKKLKHELQTKYEDMVDELRTKRAINEAARCLKAEQRRGEIHPTKITLVDRGETFSPRYEYYLVYPTVDDIVADHWEDFPKEHERASYLLFDELKGNISECVTVCTDKHYEDLKSSEYYYEGYKSYPAEPFWSGKEDTEALKEQRLEQLEEGDK